MNPDFRFGGDVGPSKPPSHLDDQQQDLVVGPMRHDRNQSLPNVHEGNQPVKVRPHRAATYSRAGPSSYAVSQLRSGTPVVPSKSANRPPKPYSGEPTPLSQEQINNSVDGTSGLQHSNGQHGSGSSEAGSRVKQQLAKAGEPKTPSEYALHILFTQFVRHAEKKLNVCLNYMRDTDHTIDGILGKGVDTQFDKIVESLGYIARQKPKPVIDSVMFWRKSKAEAAAAAAQALDAVKQEDQKNTGAHSRSGSRVDADLAEARESAIQADRKSLISIYILCRVLMEIVHQAPPQSLDENLSEKLEEIVYKQLKTADAYTLSVNGIRRSNWNLFTALLGEMSSCRFASVGDRFIADLEKFPDVPAKDAESGYRFIIMGMKHLQLKLYPMDSLEESAEFLESIAKFFGRSHSQTIKMAYSDLLSQILIPLAGPASVELNHPTWAKAIETLYSNALDMMQKPKYWHTAYPLSCILLSVAPQEMFSQKWMALFEWNISKFKDKTTRSQLFIGSSRLLWVFTFRWVESLNNTTKKLDNICKSLINPTNRKLWNGGVEKTIMPSCISIIRIGAHAYQQYILENVIFQMLIGGVNNVDNFVLEHILPERATIGIKSFIYILYDTEFGHKPEFPTLDALKTISNELVELPSSFTPQSNMTCHYSNFCKVMNRMLVILDGQVGAQVASHTEKESQGSKAMGVSFHFGNDSSSTQSSKQGYQDVFKAVLECIPWAVPMKSVYLKTAVEILAKNVTHPNRMFSDIATRALKTLARKNDTVAVIMAYIKMVFSADEKLLTSSEVSLTASSDFEQMLRIYVELLEDWFDRLTDGSGRQSSEIERDDTSEPPCSPDKSDDLFLSTMIQTIEEVEGNSLFFLCSQDRSIRHLAIKLLKLTLKFDTAVIGHEKKAHRLHSRELSKTSGDGPSRIIQYIESADVLELFNKAVPAVNLSSPERSRLAKLHNRKRESLIRLAESDYGVDAALWIKVFPLFIKACFENYPIPVAICRNIVCIRLVRMYDVVAEFARTELGNGSAAHSLILKHPMRIHSEIVVEQWRVLLVVACATLTLTDEQKLYIPDNAYHHSRKKSTQKVTIHHQRITSIRSVFRMVIPLLEVGHPVVRDAIVDGISCINVNVYKALLECLHPEFEEWKDHVRQYGTSTSNGFSSSSSLSLSRQTNNSAGRRESDSGYHGDRIITEIGHLLCVTCHYLTREEIIGDEWIVTELMRYLNELRNFLARREVQSDHAYSKLRRYFCRLLESVYISLSADDKRNNPIGFESRVRFFALIQEWCHYGKYYKVAQEREDIVRRSALSGCQDSREHHMVLASLELEKRKFESAVISAMAALCYGTIKSGDTSDDRANGSYVLQVNGIMSWINALFAAPRDDIQTIGRRALKYFLITNSRNSAIMEEAIANCYNNQENAKLSENYFMTICEVFEQVPDYPCYVRQLISLGLFKTGDTRHHIRTKAVKLLRSMELRFYGSTCLDAYETGICSHTLAVCKRSMFNLSSNFSKIHPKETFHVFSELTKFFHLVGDDASRRDILTVLLPWIQCVELQFEAPNETPTPASCLVLNNLLEITIVFSGQMQNEVEALWVALANGLYPSNARIIMDRIIMYSLERRDPQLVEFAKQILVYLASTAVGSDLRENLLGYLQPKTMIPMHVEPLDMTIAEAVYPYVANIAETLPPKGKESSFSKGHLAMIVLTDLISGPQEELALHRPLMLHVTMVLFDHYIPVVSDHARQLLAHIVQEHSHYSPDGLKLRQELDTTDFDAWTYDSLNSENSGARAPKSMIDLVSKILALFEPTMPDIRQAWAKVALQWATTCPVRHIACRSFQVFRCLLTTINQSMLADMLARLSNTIADNSLEIQGFAMQILMTMNKITAELPEEDLLACPQLFWAIVACLETIHEEEFIESLSILEKYLSKVDLNQPENVAFIMSSFPPKWEGQFLGLQQAIIPGLRSAVAYEQTLKVLDILNYLEPSDIVAGPERLPLAVMINLPRYLHSIDKPQEHESEIIGSALQLKNLCDSYHGEQLAGLSRILESVGKRRFRSKKDLLQQTVQTVQANFFPEHEVTVLIFLLGLLFNKMRWVREEVMEILKLVFPRVDMQQRELAEIGADIISPLLRLLQTDYVEEALSVLDTAVCIPASQMDKHVLRMSLGNKTIRKEYEKMATIFGIPDDSGWAIPKPAVTAAVVRNNVHAVFYICGDSKNTSIVNPDSEIISVVNVGAPDDLQFYKDDYNLGFAGSGFERQDSVSLVEGDAETTSLTNMWTTLDNLDSFFAEGLQNNANRMQPNRHNMGPGFRGASNPIARDEQLTIASRAYSDRNPDKDKLMNRFRRGRPEVGQMNMESRGMRNKSGVRRGHEQQFSVTDTDTSTDTALDATESVPQLYDKKVSLILNRSLARTPSTTSFKTYLADSFGNSPLTPTISDSSQRHPLSATRIRPQAFPDISNNHGDGDLQVTKSNEIQRQESSDYEQMSPQTLVSTPTSVSRPSAESPFRLDSFLKASHLRKGKKKDKNKYVNGTEGGDEGEKRKLKGRQSTDG